MSQRVYSFIRLSWVTARTGGGFVWDDGIRDVHEQHYQEELTLPLPIEIPEGRDVTRDDLEQVGKAFGWRVVAKTPQNTTPFFEHVKSRGADPELADLFHKALDIELSHRSHLDFGDWQVDIKLPVTRAGSPSEVFTIYDVPPRFAFNLARRLSRDCGPFFLIEVDHGYGEPTVVESHSIPEGYWTQDDGWEDLPELL